MLNELWIDEALISALDRRLVEKIKSNNTDNSKDISETNQQTEFDLTSNRRLFLRLLIVVMILKILNFSLN